MVPQGGELFLKNKKSRQLTGRRQRQDIDSDRRKKETIFDIDGFSAC